jgi:hypothetical protein
MLLILSLISIATVVAEEEEEESEEEEAQLYLYEEDGGKVIEYILPEKSPTVDPEKPDFLYAPNQGYRIVDSTLRGGPPHCRHFSFISWVHGIFAPERPQFYETTTVHSVSCRPPHFMSR